MDINKIHGADYNPRIISQESFKGLKKSVTEFGNISGITFNKRTGNLVTGHQRFKVLNETADLLTLEKLADDTFRFLDKGKDTGYNLRVVDWDLEKEKLANIAANNHQISGLFDTDMLYTLIEDVKDFSPELYKDLRIPDLQKDLGIFFNPDDTVGEDPLETKTPEDKEDDYLNKDSRKIVLFLEGEELQYCMEKANHIIEMNKTIDTVTDVFVHVMRHYAVPEFSEDSFEQGAEEKTEG